MEFTRLLISNFSEHLMELFLGISLAPLQAGWTIAKAFQEVIGKGDCQRLSQDVQVARCSVVDWNVAEDRVPNDAAAIVDHLRCQLKPCFKS